MGRQYVLHSSPSALRAVSSPVAESAQARTTLQRVVENRSGDRFPSMTVSGVTVLDHRIYGMLGKLKRRRSRGVGAAAACHGPLSTSHPLSREALGVPLHYSSPKFGRRSSRKSLCPRPYSVATGENLRRIEKILGGAAQLISSLN